METRPDILLADFESDDWGGWTVEGTAFGPGPARGALPGQAEVTGYLGDGYASSFHGGDPALGRLISPPFTVQRRYLSFLIGGGRHTYYGNNDPGYVAVNLVHDGHVVRTAPRSQWAPDGCRPPGMGLVRPCRPGRHAGPGGDRRSAHRPLGSHPGRPVRTDRHPAGPAAVVRGAPLPRRAPVPQPPHQPAITLSGSYSSPAAGRTVASNTLCLARDDPDFWVPVDLSAWKGMDLTLRIEERRRRRDAAGRGPPDGRAHRRPDGRLRRPVSGARPAAAPLHAAPGRVLGRQRPGLARWGVAPALPARAVQRHSRQRELQLGLGSRGQPRPGDVGRASRHALAGRAGCRRLGLVRRRPPQLVRSGQRGPSADDGLLHRLRRLQPAVPRPIGGRLHRLQHRSGAYLASLRRQPGHPQHRSRQSRREGVLV